jgi:hypothetical protein
MDDDGLVTEKVRRAGIGGEVEVCEGCLERRGGDVSVLAGQVASLAGLWSGDFAWVIFTAVGWVEMG